jgi:soluble lytic murein transglycosylase
MTMKVGEIPGDVKDKLKADFKRSGITDPTDADLLGAYLHIKIAQSKAQ